VLTLREGEHRCNIHKCNGKVWFSFAMLVIGRNGLDNSLFFSTKKYKNKKYKQKSELQIRKKK